MANLLWTLQWDNDWVTTVAFLGERSVAAGNNLGEMLIWDLPAKPGDPAPLPVRKLVGHTNTLSRLLLTPDGKTLVSSSYDHSIRCWDARAEGTGEPVAVALNARVREDRRRSSSKIPPLMEAKVKTQPSSRTLSGHREWVSGMSLSRDGKTLLSGDDGGQVIVWDFLAGKERLRWQTKGWCYAVALSPDARQALISERVPLVFDSGRIDSVKLYDATTGKVQHDLGPAFKGIYLSAAAFSPDGKVLAVARGGEADGNNGKVFLVDPATGKKTQELVPGHLNGATDVVFHPDGKRLASCGRDTVVRMWDASSGKMIEEIGKGRGGQFKDWIHAVSFSPDGKLLAAADMIGAVQIWSLT